MLKIDLEMARKLVRLAIEERGEDYIYPFGACSNVFVPGFEYFSKGDNDGEHPVVFEEAEPGCIVGLAMFKAGFTLEQINIPGGMISMAADFKKDGIAEFTPLTRYYLSEIQGYQDAGNTWGQSLTHGETMIYSAYAPSDTFN